MFRSDSTFGRFMNKLGDILYVGILWVIASLPLVTAGAAATAAYYAMAKSVRCGSGYISREFLHSFKRNLRQSLPLSCLFLASAAVLATDIIYLWGHDSALNSALFVILVFLSLLLLSLMFYLFPLLSRFDRKNLELIRLSALLTFRYLPVTAGLLALEAAAFLGMYLMPWAVFVIPGAWMYAVTWPMEWILRKLMPQPKEGSEEAQKWYYSAGKDGKTGRKGKDR